MGEIIVKDLKKEFSFYVNTGILKREKRTKQAVCGISFSVSEGDVMGLVGANGAGKTTIVKMLAGVLKPDCGTVTVDGEDPFLRSLKFRNTVSIVFGQKGKLHPDMSVLESSAVYGAMYGLTEAETKQRIHKLGNLLSLTEDDLSKQARALSLGQRMKGEICLSFLNEPKIIFMDEPTLGLDIVSTRSIRAFLKQYCIEHSAVTILTSHDLGDIVEACSKLLIIENGKKVFFGSISDLPKNVENNIIVHFDCPNEKVLRKANALFPGTSIQGNTATMSCKANETDDVLNALYGLGQINHLKIEETPIERIIEELIHAE